MAKQRKSGVSASSAGDATARLKPKRTRKSVPRRECPSQRTSVYRGVTRHRWTGRFEAHLWDKNTWSETQRKKKGRQIYLGAYGGEEAAARAYDLAALKYWGRDNTILNFPLSNYDQDLKEMGEQSREEYIGSLRRTSTGFSRGVSKFRGVARHHHNGKWEARIGRVFGNKYLYLGTYGIYSSLPESSRGTKRTREQHQLPTWSSGARGSSTTSSISTLSSQATIKTTQEEAAMAYDMAAIEHRGLNAVTNFDVSRYIKWHHLCRAGAADGRGQLPIDMTPHPTVDLDGVMAVAALHDDDQMLQSPGLKEMIEWAAASESSTGSRPSSPCSPSPPAPLELSQQQPQPEYSTGASSVRCSFPDDVQTYFGCEDHDGGVGYAEVDTFLLGDLGAYASPMFQFELDV